MGILNPPVLPGVYSARVANGTGNIAREPAMTRVQAAQAILNGIDLVRGQKEEGTRLLAAGEMGIGNTTTDRRRGPACLLDLPPSVTAGRGAGLSDAGLVHKVTVIQRALVQTTKPKRSSGCFK